MSETRNCRDVVWRRSSELQTVEWCRLVESSNDNVVEGLILGAVSGLPLRIEYRVVCHSNWLTSKVELRQQYGRDGSRFELARDANGAWTRDGRPLPTLGRCTDVDLGFSPSTNTLPIRRLALGIGRSETIDAAWILFPDLQIRASPQTYTRLSDQSYRYASGNFSAELTVDAAALVIDYWAWHRIGEMT